MSTSQSIDAFLSIDLRNLYLQLSSLTLSIKGRVQCFSMQVVMNKRFLLNPEKNLIKMVFESLETDFNLLTV